MSSHSFEPGRSFKPKKKFGPRLPETREEWFSGQYLFVILEMASLETAKTRHGFELLNSTQHHSLLLKHKKSPEMYRPDIVHQALLTLLDSPLNKAGKLRVFIHTQKNVLIEVNPKLRVPRTYNRFAGLMVQLLYQFRIRAKFSNEKLLKIIKNPITKHLPPNVPIIGTSSKGKLIDIQEWVQSTSNVSYKRKSKPIVFVFGAHAHGPIKCDYINENDIVSVSQYPLSSATAISRVLNAFEKSWNIL